MDTESIVTPVANSPQEAFLRSAIAEVGFGGQAGGMKSFSLILDALGQIHMKGYNAIMFRRTYKQLSGGDGLIELANEVYPLIGGVYTKSEYLWTFKDMGYPGTIRFAHLEHEKSVANHRGHQYAWIGFDELQDFTERQYLFLFSRARSKNPQIRSYRRATFNPGGIGQNWIKKRFIDTHIVDSPKYFRRLKGVDTQVAPTDPLATARLFIPSSLEQNPYLWQDGRGEYVKNLEQLDYVDYRRLRFGDWLIKREGLVYHQFSPDNVISYDAIPFDRHTIYYHSHDFGSVNRTWALIALCSNGKYYLIHEEVLPEATTSQRAKIINAHLAGKRVIAGYGGAKGEDQQRKDYGDNGVTIRLPKVTDVESQIDITNDMFAEGNLFIANTCGLTIDQLENCIRAEDGTIQDKATWHHLDTLRYFSAGVGRIGKGKRKVYGFIS